MSGRLYQALSQFKYSRGWNDTYGHIVCVCGWAPVSPTALFDAMRKEMGVDVLIMNKVYTAQGEAAF